MRLPLSGSQTVGPYFAIGMGALCSQQVPFAEEASRLTIQGRLLDGEGQPIPDGVLEIWQADPQGQFSEDPGAQPTGFARVSTAPEGSFRFTTAKPSPVPYDADRTQAPHLLVLVFMRGLQRNLVTRMYFPDEAANESDPILQLVPAARRHTLIAQPSGPGTLQWDIVMRSEAPTAQPETVFFAW